MDLSRLSDSDLRALSKNNLRDVSDAGLKLLAADEDTPKARKGLGAALGKGTESTLGGLGTGFKGLFSPEEAAKQGLERSKALNEKYEEQVSFDKLKEAYEKRGFTGAGGELLRQIPLAIAEQAPNIATTVGGARLGAMAGSPFGPVGAGIGALGGAVAPSLLQMFGSNIERQAATQEEAGQPIDISRARALGAAIPQAALETAANVIPLGGRVAGKIFGPEVEKLLARGGTKAAEKLAQEKFATTVGKGLATGAIAEIPTEIAQQVLERAQAGLDLTSPDALKEYGETAYQVGLLAPIGAGGRFVDKSGAKSKIAAEKKVQEDKLAQEEQALKEQEILAKQAEEQQLALQQKQQETGNLFGDVALQTEAKGKKLVEGAVSPLTSEPELFQTGVNEQNEPTYGVRQTVPETRTVAEREAEASQPPEITPQEIFRQHDTLKKYVDDLQDKMSKAAISGDIDVLPDLSAQLSNAQKALVESNKRVKQTAPVEQTNEVQLAQLKGQIRSKTDALKKAGDLGDFDKISKLSAEIKEIQTKIKAIPQSEDLIAQAERLKTEAVAQQGEQLQQQQEDLFAQVAKPEPKKEQANQEVLQRYQKGVQDIEDAYAAGASERIINNLIDELRKTAGEKEASKASIVSGETIEQQTQQVDRVNKALEAEKVKYNEAKSDEERADALKNVGVLQDRLATAQTELAQGRPEVAEKDAFERQEEAKLDAVETVRQILSGDYFNSKNVDVASSMKPQLETKIQDAGNAYAKAAIDEINAVRAQSKQQSLSTDEGLRLVTGLQGRFNYLAKDPTYLAEKVRDTNLKTFEDSLERIKKGFFEGPSSVQRGPEVLRQERNPIEMLRTEQAKKKPNPNVVAGLKREIEAGKKEDDRIAVEKDKQEKIAIEQKSPSGVNPDQLSLFGEKALEPLATVRATPSNFKRLVDIRKARFNVAEKQAEKILKEVEEKTKAAETRWGKGEDKDSVQELLQNYKEQKELVHLITNADKFRKLAKDLWENSTDPDKLKIIDVLYARANKVANENLALEQAILRGLEKKVNAIKDPTSVMAKRIANEKERIRTEIGKTEAAAEEMLKEQAIEKRKAEERMAEELAKLPSTRQEIITTNVKTPGSDVKGTRKQIIKKEAAKTKEEIAEENKSKAEFDVNSNVNLTLDAAKQMADIKNTQNNRLKLKKVKKIESKLKKDLAAKKEEIQKDITNLSALTKALETTKTVENKDELQKQLKALNKNIETKQLGKAVDIIESNLKLLKNVGSDVERALTVLGNTPAKTERKKPLKTGVSKVEKKLEKDFEESGALKRYGNEKYVDSGLEKEQYDSMFNDIRNRDVSFRIEDTDTKATPLTKVQVVDVLSKIKMPKGLNVLVLNKVPAELKAQFEAMGHDASKVKGWVSPNGTVFIVAENHTSIPDVNETIAHELIGHLGVEALLGEKGMRSLISKIVDQDGGVIALAKKLDILPEVYGTYHAAKNQGLSEFEAQSAAVRELLAHTAEKEPNKSTTQKAKDFIKLVVAHVRDGLRRLGVKLDVSTSDVYKIIYKARKNFDSITPGAFVNTDGAIKFNVARPKATPAFEGVLNSTKGIVAEQKSWLDRVRGEASGLVFETKYIDRFAPVQKVFQHMKESLMATQVMYFLRMADQRMAFTSEVLSNGPLDLVPAKDGKGFMIESQKGTSFIDVVNALKPANVGDVNATNRVFTLYLLAIRARDPRVGLAKLNYSGKITQKMLDDAIATVESDPATKNAFENAAAIYAKYNEGLINFAVKSGAISKDIADVMLKNKNYVPFYRQKEDGSVMLEIGGAPAIKIGNLADQPYLHELIGGDQPIFDVFTSALQNTSMLTDMALRNIATKNTANALAELGLLESSKTGKDNGIHKATKDSQGPTGPDVIHFKENGINYWARVKSESAGVPSQLLVKGLEGVNTSLPNIVKTMGGFSTTLRKWVTRNPAYNLRQLVRDPLNGVIVAGLDTTPIASSLKEVYKMIKGTSEGEAILGSRGILGGQVLTGTAEDMQLMLKAIMSGEKGWDYRMAQLDMMAVKGDAATRVVMYNNYLKQGLSEIEATLATLESMNFSKRGISSSLFMASTMVPFMNAQIQGLNVLYKSFTGNMPFNEKLQIKNKLVQRASMLFASSVMYAFMMQDDEAYQNANDDEKYSNWFMYTPFSDEPIKIPIPFEVGFLFKAVPEALVNLMYSDDKARDVGKAIAKQAFNAVPNITPQGIKPAVEALFNYSLFTNREIDSDRMMQYEPGERYGERTTELAKLVGGAFNISPNKIEYLIRGYFGSVPIALASMANPILRTGEGGEQPESRGIASSETPIIGTFFQPKDAGGAYQSCLQRHGRN